jgi:hypothetical protein
MSKIEVNTIEPQCGTNLTLGASGDTVIIPSGATISNQGTAAGFGPTGAVSWDTTKITTDPNPAVTGVGYFADTTSAAFTITLPSSPSAGAVVGIADYANTFATNNLTVDRNGSPIGGVAANATLSTNGVSITLVYVDATQGWIITDSGSRSDVPTPTYIAATGGTITECGDYKIHTFTGPGTFTVSCAGNPLGSTAVDYLVVAGGGSGGQNHGGGAGAGGYRESSGAASGCYSVSPLGSGVSALPVSAQGYPITVGGGGAPAGPGVGNVAGNSGSNSVFSTITSAGGAGGGSFYFNCATGLNGGSGGGGGGGVPGTSPLGGGNKGNGNTPPVSPPQGNNGGCGSSGPAAGNGGGGGGATVAGGNSSGTTPAGGTSGTGGNGATSSINGTPTARAGGGSGGRWGSGSVGAAGTGGGGTGGTVPQEPAATAGTTNTGGGGGGGSDDTGSGAAGGSGIVIIRYKFQ